MIGWSMNPILRPFDQQLFVEKTKAQACEALPIAHPVTSRDATSQLTMVLCVFKGVAAMHVVAHMRPA